MENGYVQILCFHKLQACNLSRGNPIQAEQGQT